MGVTLPLSYTRASEPVAFEAYELPSLVQALADELGIDLAVCEHTYYLTAATVVIAASGSTEITDAGNYLGVEAGTASEVEYDGDANGSITLSASLSVDSGDLGFTPAVGETPAIANNLAPLVINNCDSGWLNECEACNSVNITSLSYELTYALIPSAEFWTDIVGAEEVE